MPHESDYQGELDTFFLDETVVQAKRRGDSYQEAWIRFWNTLPSRHPWVKTPSPAWFQKKWSGFNPDEDAGGEPVAVDTGGEPAAVTAAKAKTKEEAIANLEGDIETESNPEKRSYLKKVLDRLKALGEGVLEAADRLFIGLPSFVLGSLYDAAVSSGLVDKLLSWIDGDDGDDIKAILEDNGISIDDDGGVIGFTPGEPDLGEPDDEQFGFTPGEPDLGLPGPGGPGSILPRGEDQGSGVGPGGFGPSVDPIGLGTGGPPPGAFVGGVPGEPGGGGGLGATEGPLFVETAGGGAFADEQLRIEEAFNQYGTDVGAATDIFTGTTAGILEDWRAYQTYLDTTNQEITANIDLAQEDVKAAYASIGASFDVDIAAARSPENQLGVKLPGYLGGASFQLNPGAAINSAIDIANTRGGLAGDEAGSVLDLIGASGSQLDRFSAGTTTALGNRASLAANELLAGVGEAEAKRLTADQAMELLLTERAGQYGVARAGAGVDSGSIWDSLLPSFAYLFGKDED